MALVAYGLSDSESEHSETDEFEEGGSVTLINSSSKRHSVNINRSDGDSPSINQLHAVNGKINQVTEGNDVRLFNSLPLPKPSSEIKEDEQEDEFLLKKEVPTERPPVKIMIPSLTDFDSDDEDEPKEKKQKFTQKSSGLFAVLPPPKTSPLTVTSFVPNVLKKAATSLRPTQLKKQAKKAAAMKAQAAALKLKSSVDTDDDEDEVPVDSFDDETWKQVCGRRKKAARVVPVIVSDGPEIEVPLVNATPVAPEPYSGLDNEAFKKLVGSNKRRGNIKLIDLNEEEVKADTDLWMMKALTDPESKPKYVVENPVNDTCKKKHHITYLAEQAKANEQELQNQWSQSRYSRMQTQAKYGF